MRGWVDPRITLDVSKNRLLLTPTGIRVLNLPAGSSVATPTTSALLHITLFYTAVQHIPHICLMDVLKGKIKHEACN